MKNKRFFRVACIFTALISLGIGVGYHYASYYQQQEIPNVQGLLWPEPKQLRAFATIDQNDEIFSIDKLEGKWSFFFFGYTNCPDVCPITLSVFNEFHDRLIAQQQDENVQFIFVTVDPERDTTEKLKQYTGYFNPALIGLGGNITQVTSLTSQFGVVFMHGEKQDTGGYLVDHTASVFLTDPLGRIVGIFSAPHEVESFMNRFLVIREFIESQS